MITAAQISTALGYPVILTISGQSASIDDAEHPATLNGEGELEYPENSRVEPWHQTYVQACFDAGTILPYDEAKAEQLYNWQQAGVPLSVTRRQLLLELYITDGTEESDILTAIDGIADAQTKAIALIEFKQALTFDRDNPFVAQIGTLLGLSESDINDRFINAKTR